MKLPKRTRVKPLVGVALFLFGILSPPSTYTRADDKTLQASLPARLSGFSDEGTFAIYKDEDRLVTMNLVWRKDGAVENKVVITMAGQTVTHTMKITPDKEGCWAKIELVSPRGPMTFERRDNVSRKTFKDKVETTNLK